MAFLVQDQKFNAFFVPFVMDQNLKITDSPYYKKLKVNLFWVIIRLKPTEVPLRQVFRRTKKNIADFCSVYT